MYKAQHDSQYSERSNDQCKEIEENNRMGRLDISSRKLDIGNISERLGNVTCKDGHNKTQKQYGHNRSRIY